MNIVSRTSLTGKVLKVRVCEEATDALLLVRVGLKGEYPEPRVFAPQRPRSKLDHDTAEPWRPRYHRKFLGTELRPLRTVTTASARASGKNFAGDLPHAYVADRPVRLLALPVSTDLDRQQRDAYVANAL